MIQVTKKLNVPVHKQCIQIKIALLGDQQCGKTALVSKYVSDTTPSNYQPTLGVQTGNKYVPAKGGQVHLTLWDFSGKLDFMQIRNEFYRQIQCALVCADLSSKNSTDNVQYWLREIKESGASPAIIIVGTKADIKKGTDLSKVAKQKGFHYFEVSSKTGDGVQQLMQTVVSESL